MLYHALLHMFSIFTGRCFGRFLSELPKIVSEYVAKHLAGKKIKEASKITDAKGVVTYEAEIDDADYIFDANGNFMKKNGENAGKDKD